jgi:DNA-binding transcriptional regulator GbsR (MarR family)
VEDRFLTLWTGLAALGGVSPTQARIHGLLFLAPRPLDAETVQSRLGISHGACSGGLNELLDRGLVRRVRPPGTRRVKYAADPDGWAWLRGSVRERRQREVQPLLDAAREIAALADEAAARAREARAPGRGEIEEARTRVRAFEKFLGEFAGMLDDFVALGGGRPGRLLRAVHRAASRPPSRPGRPR